MFNDQCFGKKLRNEMIKKIQRIFFLFLKYFKKNSICFIKMFFKFLKSLPLLINLQFSGIQSFLVELTQFYVRNKCFL